MDKEERRSFFKELISCSPNLFYWRFDSAGLLVDDTCSNSVSLLGILNHYDSVRRLLDRAVDDGLPVLLDLPVGLSWLAVFEKENGELRAMHMIGPVYSVNAALHTVERALQGLNITVAMRSELLSQLRELPLMPYAMQSQYAVMLHYCVNGQRVESGDVGRMDSGQSAPGAEAEVPYTDRYRVYMVEQGILRMIREGDMNYKMALSRGMLVSSGVRVQTRDALGKNKITTIVFTSLCSRAAIEGGLTPDVAYSVGDRYIQMIEDSSTIAELTNITYDMYADFIYRVRRCRTNPDLSEPVQSCCDFIEMHVEETLPLGMLAQRAGYTDYYFSRKFKKEVGVAILDYIKIAKVERAKLYLRTTGLSVQQIADQLNFSSRSRFSETFAGIVGTAPGLFRAQNGRY